ncbi:MAG: hypothetical protein ABIN13_11565 [Mucilaginibacter sp.]
MRKIRITLMMLLLAGAIACNKNDGVKTGITANVSESDAADMVGASLSVNSNGLASVSNDVTIKSKWFIDNHLTCGATKADTLTKTSPQGAPVKFSYGLGFTYTLNCNASNIPDNITGKVNFSGSHSGPHVSSTSTGNLTFRIAGLTPTATNYVLNATFIQSGSFVSKKDTTNHGNENLTVVVQNLRFNKPVPTIAGGTATFTLNGTVPKKGAFSYAGTLVFNSDGTAKLTVNGSVFIINLITGEKTKA